jgi:hypothetical protein
LIGIKVLQRVSDEFGAASSRAKVLGAAAVVGLLGCGVRIDTHTADWVSSRFGSVVAGCVPSAHTTGSMGLIMVSLIAVCVLVLGVASHRSLLEYLDK